MSPRDVDQGAVHSEHVEQAIGETTGSIVREEHLADVLRMIAAGRALTTVDAPALDMDPAR